MINYELKRTLKLIKYADYKGSNYFEKKSVGLMQENFDNNNDLASSGIKHQAIPPKLSGQQNANRKSCWSQAEPSHLSTKIGPKQSLLPPITSKLLVKSNASRSPLRII